MGAPGRGRSRSRSELEPAARRREAQAAEAAGGAGRPIGAAGRGPGALPACRIRRRPPARRSPCAVVTIARRQSRTGCRDRQRLTTDGSAQGTMFVRVLPADGASRPASPTIPGGARPTGDAALGLEASPRPRTAHGTSPARRIGSTAQHFARTCRDCRGGRSAGAGDVPTTPAAFEGRPGHLARSVRTPLSHRLRPRVHLRPGGPSEFADAPRPVAAPRERCSGHLRGGRPSTASRASRRPSRDPVSDPPGAPSEGHSESRTALRGPGSRRATTHRGTSPAHRHGPIRHLANPVGGCPRPRIAPPPPTPRDDLRQPEYPARRPVGHPATPSATSGEPRTSLPEPGAMRRDPLERRLRPSSTRRPAARPTPRDHPARRSRDRPHGPCSAPPARPRGPRSGLQTGSP